MGAAAHDAHPRRKSAPRHDESRDDVAQPVRLYYNYYNVTYYNYTTLHYNTQPGLARLRGDPRRSDIVAVDLMVRSLQAGRRLGASRASAAAAAAYQQ